MHRRRSSRDFAAHIASPAGYDVLFDHLPDVYFFVKDSQGRFVRCNQAFVGLLRASSENEVIGRRDQDFFPHDLAENYISDDRAVMASGVPLIEKVELLRNANGSIDWFNTTKVPILDRYGKAIGIAGITRDLKRMNSNNARFLFWAPVLETMLSDYAQALPTAYLAAKVGLSVSQFDRQFKRKFHTTPRKYIVSIRLNAACQLLVSTDLPMAAIALETGFYDQSHFTNQFVRCKGMAPTHYRKKYAPSIRKNVPDG